MYISDTEKSLKTGMIYLAVSLAIAAAAAVYGLFSHGVYSYWMTYAFMIPMLLGAVPHLANALRTEASKKEAVMQAASGETKRTVPAVNFFGGCADSGDCGAYGREPAEGCTGYLRNDKQTADRISGDRGADCYRCSHSCKKERIKNAGRTGTRNSGMMMISAKCPERQS